jgi:hypothetical protein
MGKMDLVMRRIRPSIDLGKEIFFVSVSRKLKLPQGAEMTALPALHSITCAAHPMMRSTQLITMEVLATKSTPKEDVEDMLTILVYIISAEHRLVIRTDTHLKIVKAACFAAVCMMAMITLYIPTKSYITTVIVGSSLL